MNAHLSGRDWWKANQAKYPNSTSLDDLDSGFREKVQQFIDTLKDAGATVSVNSTKRNPHRAHLMHFSWKVAYGEIAPEDVPEKGGLQIAWDHGDIDKSREAAKDMVKLFHMKYIASLNSNHIRGKAVDMDINWKGSLVLCKPSPLLARIETKPTTGQNRQLHEIGKDVFGVIKLVSDPPHWSYNGR